VLERQLWQRGESLPTHEHGIDKNGMEERSFKKHMISDLGSALKGILIWCQKLFTQDKKLRKKSFTLSKNSLKELRSEEKNRPVLFVPLFCIP
jgi:hypothetical protein